MRKKNWLLRSAHEWAMTFLSPLLINKSLSNCVKRGNCIIFKLKLRLFWVNEFKKLCSYMKLLCIRYLFQLLSEEKSKIYNFEFLDIFDWKQPECRSWRRAAVITKVILKVTQSTCSNFDNKQETLIRFDEVFNSRNLNLFLTFD